MSTVKLVTQLVNESLHLATDEALSREYESRRAIDPTVKAATLLEQFLAAPKKEQRKFMDEVIATGILGPADQLGWLPAEKQDRALYLTRDAMELLEEVLVLLD